MTFLYDDIFSHFLSKITDYKILTLSEDDIFSMEEEYLKHTLGNPLISRVFSSIELSINEDDKKQIVCELKNKSSNNSDDLFVLELLTLGMVIEWLEPQVKSVLNTAQMFGGKEEKFYAQANHLNSLKEMLQESKRELRHLVRDHSFICNSYISEV